jgi:5-methyltetrahydropteroyltriglutamate--homocysteine methyltransferase
MKPSKQGIRTSHVGALPPAPGWRGRLGSANWAERPAGLEEEVAAVVKMQSDIGLNCIGDGEFWNGRNFFYYGKKFSGVTVRDLRPGERGSGRESTRERDEFKSLYGDMDRVGTVFCVPGEQPLFLPQTNKMVVTGPLQSRDDELLQYEIKVFKAALERAGGQADEAFICVPAPNWLDHFIYNEYYKTDEEYAYAMAEALRSEYRAIVEAGFILQIDNPGIVTSWDMIKLAPTLSEYRRYQKTRVDALNHVISGLPPEMVRLHFCWGSWHGAHTHDIPLRDVLDLVLQVNVQTYAFEAGNVRHEHEWTVWKEAKIPDDKLLMPGVVSHATNIVEHPELVARRIQNFADVVGRERVIAGTDCGLGHRVHEELVWAKLATLVEGARLASKVLWQR